MRVTRLSDHPGDMLQHEQRRRAAADREQRQAHEEKLVLHREQVTQARAVLADAWSAHRWGAWLRGVFAVWRVQRHPPAASIPASQPTDREAKLAAGVAGERLAEEELGRALDDQWVLLRGYRNRGGEIDHVLLGPGGLFAIEVKNQNRTIDCQGDQWWATKFDRYGNPRSGRLPMTDERGRSPSQQVNEPAGQLEGFLHRNGHQVTISRIVALIHPRAQLRTCTQPTVQIARSARELARLVNRAPGTVTPAERAELERLIIQDHHVHEKRRSR